MGGEEASQVVMGGGALRLELEGRQVLLEGLPVELLLRVDGGEVVVSVRRLGIELDGLLELLDGLVEPTSIGELDPAGVVLVGADSPVPVASHGPLI